MREKQRLKELVKRVQRDDPKAMVELIIQFNPKIKVYSRQLGYEDAYSDLIVWLISSVKRYPMK